MTGATDAPGLTSSTETFGPVAAAAGNGVAARGTSGVSTGAGALVVAPTVCADAAIAGRGDAAAGTTATEATVGTANGGGPPVTV